MLPDSNHPLHSIMCCSDGRANPDWIVLLVVVMTVCTGRGSNSSLGMYICVYIRWYNFPEFMIIQYYYDSSFEWPSPVTYCWYYYYYYYYCRDISAFGFWTRIETPLIIIIIIIFIAYMPYPHNEWRTPRKRSSVLLAAVGSCYRCCTTRVVYVILL